MLRRKAEVFSPTDGVVYVCSDTEERGQRGANFADAALLSRLFPLDYRRMRISSRDVELMDATGIEMTVKIEVRSVAALAPESDVTDTEGRVFELTRVEDRGRTSWLWLSEIETDGTCTLVSEVTERDSHGIPTQTASEATVFCRRIGLATERKQADGIELRPQVTLRLRQSDYEGESTLVRGGTTYTVIATSGSGRWVDLTCERKAANR